MAAMISLAAVLAVAGSGFALAILGFMVVMLVVWALTNFCPSSWMMKKIGLQPCGFGV
jgi:hypothetical protein